MAKYTGRRIVPKHAGEWDIRKEYEELQIVLDADSGNSFISNLPVPKGTALSDEKYWSLFSLHSEQIAEAEEHLTQTAEDIRSELLETENRINKNVSDTEGRINESLSSTESKVNTSLSETENRVTARVENAKSDLTAKVAAAEQQMNQNAQNVAQTNKALNARMDQIAKGRTSDTEVLDARVDSEGNTFDNLGAAIRSIYPKAKEGLDALQESKVDANYDATGELTEGITVNTINGETQKFEHVQTTALIPVNTACQKVYYTGQVFNWIGVAGYDANGTFVASILDSRDTEQPQEYKEKELEIPEGVFQIRASSYAKDLNLKVCGESVKLYVEMDYCNDQLMHYYVVGSKLVNLGSIASTDGKPKRITLEIPSKKLEDAGYKDDYIQIVFTKNSTYDMTMSNVKAHYFNVKGSYFGEDYSLLHEQADTNTKELAALSEKVRVNADAIKTADANMQNLSKTISSVSTDMQVVMKQKSAFTGKKILFLGDSITALNTSERGWVRYFNEIIQPERFVNLSVSSARWCDYEDSVYDGNPVFSGPDQNHNNVMGNQVEKLIRGKDKTSPHYKEVTAYADFDMILIACGTNDGVPSGDMEDSFTSENEMVAIEELDRRAFASAFRYSIEKLQQLYPAAKIYICTPIQGYITTRSYAQSKAKGDYLKLLAGRMSLEVIDTFCCGICDIYEKKNANGRYLIDGLHPNAAGAKKIGVFNASAVIASYR